MKERDVKTPSSPRGLRVTTGLQAGATGTVKWFNDSKGFGFIAPDGGGEDLFVHHSAIQLRGAKTLSENQRVEFDVVQGPKGWHAQGVRLA